MQLLHYNLDLIERVLADQLRVCVMGLLTPTNLSEKVARTRPFMQSKIDEHEVLKAVITVLEKNLTIVKRPRCRRAKPECLRRCCKSRGKNYCSRFNRRAQNSNTNDTTCMIERLSLNR